MSFVVVKEGIQYTYQLVDISEADIKDSENEPIQEEIIEEITIEAEEDEEAVPSGSKDSKLSEETLKRRRETALLKRYNETEDERRARLEKRKQYEDPTPEKREERLMKKRFNLWMKNQELSEEEKEKYKERRRNRLHEIIKKETPEEREIRLAAIRERNARYIANESAETKKRRIEKIMSNQKRKASLETAEEREERRSKRRQKYQNETPEEREVRLERKRMAMRMYRMNNCSDSNNKTGKVESRGRPRIESKKAKEKQPELIKKLCSRITASSKLIKKGPESKTQIDSKKGKSPTKEEDKSKSKASEKSSPKILNFQNPIKVKGLKEPSVVPVKVETIPIRRISSRRKN